MTHTRTSILGKVGPPLAAAALVGLLALGRGSVNAAQAGASSNALATSAAATGGCYTWEPTNTTGADADRLQVVLSGTQTVTAVYTGDANPLGGASAGSGYDAGSDQFTLILGPNGSTVGPDETVRVGVCTPHAVTAVRFVWFPGGNALQPDAVLPLLTWDWQGADTVHVQLKNTTGATITLLSLQLLDPETALDLADLDEAVAAQLPLAGAVVDEPVELAPGAAISATLTLAVALAGPAKPIVIEAQWAQGDDLVAANTLYAQTSGPETGRVYLPEVVR